MSGRPIPVGLLTEYIRELFDQDPLLQDVWIEGEVSESFAAKSGHVYFTLRDESTQLKCVMFKREAMRQFSLPQAGDQIAVHARIGVYEATGQYQAYVDVVQPAGVGIQALLFEQIRQRLEADGLFDPARKRPIPVAPRFIGVVTSLEGSVWHDIQHVVRRRYPLAHLIVAGSAVQGDSAPEMLIRAIERVQADGRAQVIIIARGGGSADDLSAFNDEALARAVFASLVPIISAVGHETDWTIIDFVADLRASTPSAAAELASPDRTAIEDWLDLCRRKLSTSLRSDLITRRRALVDMTRTVQPAVGRAFTDEWRRQLQQMNDVSDVQRMILLESKRMRLARSSDRARELSHQLIDGRASHLAQKQAAIVALDPVAVLRRGYSFVHLEGDDRAITSADQLAIGSRIEARFFDGSAHARIDHLSMPVTKGGLQ